MPERLEGIIALIKISAVAPQRGARVPESDIALDYLYIRFLILVVHQLVGMVKIHLLVVGLSALCRGRQADDKEA